MRREIEVDRDGLVARVRCVKAGGNPLYSPERLRERRQFTGVVELPFRSVHRNEE